MDARGSTQHSDSLLHEISVGEKRMTIAKRLTLLLAVPLLVLAVLGLFVWYQLNHIEFKNKFVGIQIESLAVIGNISQCLTEMRVSTRTYFLTEDKDEQARAEKTVRQNAAELKRLLARYGGFPGFGRQRSTAIYRSCRFEPSMVGRGS